MTGLGKQFALRLRHVFRASREGDLTPARISELSSGLEAERQSLLSFTATVEQEFLALGGRLRQINSLAREVQARSEEVIEVASGRADDAAIQFAFQLLKKAEDLVQAGREQYDSVLKVFGTMHADLAEVAQERSALMRTLQPLDSTNTQFRIQACAFNDAIRDRFFTLADAIGELVRDVQTAVGKRFEELERAGEAAGRLSASLTTMSEDQRRETQARLTETRQHLAELNEALLSSESAAQSISGTGRKIATGVSAAVVALQCQDIARQKLEHICAAIDEMRAHLDAGAAGGFSPAEQADCRHFLVDASSVELLQLQAVFYHLDPAAAEVRDGLADVDREVRYLADYAVRLGNGTINGQIISEAIGSIHAVLTVIDNAVGSTRCVIELVDKLRSTFTDCTAQILALAMGLRLVALNAQVFAAHVDEGAALEVVASNTRGIADESMEQLDGISRRVTKLVDSVIDLDQRLCDYRDLAGLEQSILVGEASESKQKLMNVEQKLRAVLTTIKPLEQELSRAIREIGESIRFPQAVAAARASSVSLFESIVRRYDDPKRTGKLEAHTKVLELKRNYTMDHEREVHNAAMGKTEGGPPADTGAAILFDDWSDVTESASAAAVDESPSEDEKLADNVELF